MIPIADRFWVAGTGNWSDNTNHWSATSGGSPGASKPTSSDNVYFDANSFTATGQTVTVNEDANCLDMDWTGATNSPTLVNAGTVTLSVYGNLKLISAMTYNFAGHLRLNGSGKTLTTAGQTINSVYIQLYVSGSSYTLQDDLTLTGGPLNLYAGSIDTNNKNIVINGLSATNTASNSLTLGSSVVTCTGNWNITNASLTLSANTSTIIISKNTKYFIGAGLTYNNVEFQGTPTTVMGSNTFGTLTVNSGKTATFTAGTTQTVTTFTADGAILQSSSAGSAYTISKATGTADVTGASIKDCTATGGATFNAVNCTNVSGNTGWNWGQTSAGSVSCSVTATGSAVVGIDGAGAASCAVTASNIETVKGLYSGLADADTYFFNFDGKLYFYDGTNYCYFDGTNSGTVASIAYVPTVLIGCAPGATPGGTVNEDYNILSNSWKQSFSGTVSDTVFTMVETSLTSIDSVYANGSLVDTDDYTVDLSAGTVAFDTSPGEGTNNVTIQATKTGLMDSTLITKCTKFDVYGGKNDNRIFACRENIRYHSGLYDPTYWPENNFALVTNDSDKIQGFGHLIDYHIILKERSLAYSTIDQDSTGAVVWPIYPMNDEYGCLAPDSIKPANNGLIFLAQTNEGSPAGVAFAYPLMVRNQMNVIIISRDINTSVHSEITGLLAYTNAELASAKAFIYDDKYWLRVKDRCWILDLKYSDFSNGVYCWYPYDGTPAKANCFLDNSGDLYIGDSTAGLIYKEGTGVDEDGVALDFYWTAPIVSCGSRTYTKEFEELAITYGRQVIAQNSLTLITDDSKEAVVVSYQVAGLLDYGAVDYGAWSYGANPYPSTQVEIIGYTVEYLQWVIQNNQLGQGLVILGQELTYKWGERV